MEKKPRKQKLKETKGWAVVWDDSEICLGEIGYPMCIFNTKNEAEIARGCHSDRPTVVPIIIKER